MAKEHTDNTIENQQYKAGELKMLLLLIVICGALFQESLKVNGVFQGFPSGPGGIPQLVSALLVCLLVIQAALMLKQGYKEGSFKVAVDLLFDRDMLVFLGMVILYGVVLETLHFIPTSILFLVGSMYLLERTSLVKKIIISVCTVAGLVLIFSTIFQVVLP